MMIRMVRLACFDVQVEVDVVATGYIPQQYISFPVILRFQLLLHVVFDEPTPLDELCSLIREMASK